MPLRSDLTPQIVWGHPLTNPLPGGPLGRKSTLGHKADSSNFILFILEVLRCFDFVVEFIWLSFLLPFESIPSAQPWLPPSLTSASNDYGHQSPKVGQRAFDSDRMNCSDFTQLCEKTRPVSAIPYRKTNHAPQQIPRKSFT